MKLLITTLTMIFISFGASAFTVEQVYKNCKPYQNNGFTIENLSLSQKQNALACVTYLRGLIDRGVTNCYYFSQLKPYITKDMIKKLSGLLANGEVSNNAVITSFINYAENNPDTWKHSPSTYSKRFINDKFPCTFDK